MNICRQILDVIHRLCLALLPSYVRNHLEGKIEEPKKLHATSYLDGFRGVVSFLVFVRHFLLPWISTIDHGFGQEVGDGSVLQFPLIRVLSSGPNVPVFLVVSGYIMSLKPIRLSREGQLPLAWGSLASSTFRRAFRIFTLPLFSSFVVMFLVQLGIFDYPYETLPGHIPAHPQRLEGIIKQLLDWLNFAFYELTNPWTWSIHLPLDYGAHLWTIPLQFRCSMVLFLLLLSLLKLSRFSRTICISILLIFTLLHGRWDVALYLGGMGLAEYDLTRRQQIAVLPSFIRENNKPTRFLSLVARSTVLCLGLYFSSFPRYRGNSSATGYHLLNSLTNNYRYWHAYGATLLVCYISHSQGAQWLFTRRWTQYLGKLSFCLYIVHEPLIHIMGLRTVEFMWRLTGNDTSTTYLLGITGAFLMTTFVLFWLADLVYCWVDKPSAKLGQWVERICTDSSPKANM